jgi:hypothetical protein
MPVAEMCISAFILRNTLSTMIANNRSEYYQFIMPPTFEEWVGLGPRRFNPQWRNVQVDENIYNI